MLITPTMRMINRMNQPKKAKIDDPGGDRDQSTTVRSLTTTEKKPPCDVCGSMLHGLRVTRSEGGGNPGVNFFCQVATREEARSDQLEPCPWQIAKYYQYDETNLSAVFQDIAEKGYGRFVTRNTIDAIENQTREICRDNSVANLPKRRKMEPEESHIRTSSDLVNGLDEGERSSRG
jgi:hypothetical protein